MPHRRRRRPLHPRCRDHLASTQGQGRIRLTHWPARQLFETGLDPRRHRPDVLWRGNQIQSLARLCSRSTPNFNARSRIATWKLITCASRATSIPRSTLSIFRKSCLTSSSNSSCKNFKPELNIRELVCLACLQSIHDLRPPTFSEHDL